MENFKLFFPHGIFHMLYKKYLFVIEDLGNLDKKFFPISLF